ncbi:hypothetical protein [Nostoc sp. 2RC]|uniref:hypothetical protein n=1 Tax=Nostoc sp. 2RC TaxID=2485484 RepID=UPI0016271A11|nr:hypothetical protein [Nostoc sp. 2RC]MBC1235908.1 hypothetical protein [Nostoc sp. 2RC]
MASTFDIKGTSLDSFKIGIGGPTLYKVGTDLCLSTSISSRVLTELEADHPGYRTGLWYATSPITDGLSSITTASTSNTISYYPFSLKKPVTILKIAFNQATSVAGNMRFGIYSNNSNTVLPSTLLVQTGELSTAGTGERSDTVFIQLPPAWYWAAISSNVSVSLTGETTLASQNYYIGRSSFGTTGFVNGYRNNYTYSSGSLPSSAPVDSLTELTTGAPFLYIKT